MTRDEILTAYRPLRTDLKRVLNQATQACRASDFTRALTLIAPWASNDQLEGVLLDMMTDIAFFEPDKRGQRAIDRYLAKQGRRLASDDRALMERMSRAWFSLFRVADWHEGAGVWLEDLLDDDRRVWVMDEGLEASAPQNGIIGLRLFDAGSFHAGFGVVLQPSDDTLGPCLAARARRTVFPESMSLAAFAYADHLAVASPVDEEDLEVLNVLAKLLGAPDTSPAIEHDERPRRGGGRRRLPKPSQE